MGKTKRKNQKKRKTQRLKYGGNKRYLLSSIPDKDGNRPLYEFKIISTYKDDKGKNANFYQVQRKRTEFSYKKSKIKVNNGNKMDDPKIYGLRLYGSRKKNKIDDNKLENEKVRNIHVKLSEKFPDDVVKLYDYGLITEMNSNTFLKNHLKKLGSISKNTCTHEQCFYNLLEYGDMDLNSCFNRLIKYDYYDKYKLLSTIIDVLLRKINKLHNDNFIHLDIKPENILLIKTDDDKSDLNIFQSNYILKFIDFSFSKKLDDVKTFDYGEELIRNTEIIKSNDKFGTLDYFCDYMDNYHYYSKYNDIYAIMRIYTIVYYIIFKKKRRMQSDVIRQNLKNIIDNIETSQSNHPKKYLFLNIVNYVYNIFNKIQNKLEAKQNTIQLFYIASDTDDQDTILDEEEIIFLKKFTPYLKISDEINKVETNNNFKSNYLKKKSIDKFDEGNLTINNWDILSNLLKINLDLYIFLEKLIEIWLDIKDTYIGEQTVFPGFGEERYDFDFDVTTIQSQDIDFLKQYDDIFSQS